MLTSVIILGLIIGYLLHLLTQKIIRTIEPNVTENKYNISKFIVMLLTSLLFFLSFLKFGIDVILIKAIALSCILIVVSFIDIKFQLIPDKLVAATLVFGSIMLFTGDVPLKDAAFGMIAGGLLMFLLALVPGSIGGGDIKFMFALGLFLGLKKILIALILSFICASAASAILLAFKLKGRKDYIPFGPFISLAAFICYYFYS